MDETTTARPLPAESLLEQDWLTSDWSFLLVVVMVVALVVVLAKLQSRANRKAKRRERREAYRKYKRWLRNSGIQPLKAAEDKDARRR